MCARLCPLTVAVISLITTNLAGQTSNPSAVSPTPSGEQAAQEGSLANADPIYRQLRAITPGTSIDVDAFTVNFDTAAFEFKSGTVTFLPPINGVVTGVIFSGTGHFRLKPVTQLDRDELLKRVHAEQVDEDFTQVVFRFSRGLHRAFARSAKTIPTPSSAAVTFRDWEDKIRHRPESPRSLAEEFLTGSSMDNVEAELLAGIYNPGHASYFTGYIKGTKHGDLRLLSKGRGGAIPGLDSPEEVALVNLDPVGTEDGIWYLAHFAPEYQQGKANSLEERRYEEAIAMKANVAIAGNTHLSSVATLRFKALVPGERVLKLSLLPNLRVSRVTDASGKQISFIQEGRKADGSFYVVLPEPLEAGKEYSVQIEYAGDKVVFKAGGGSFYVRARDEWYPNLNGFGEKTLYDLTFQVPKRYRIISVGDLKEEKVEDNLSVSHWVTPRPVAVAGFNFGAYKKITTTTENPAYQADGYYLEEIPDIFKQRPAFAILSPTSMTKFALEETRAELQICNRFFGPSSFDRVAITEQPDLNFGQSWPGLVYLPLLAYTDQTQRWMAFGVQNGLTSFVDEVTPHEVAHQWWGHSVGWASYHDQWLSEGFAEFSAGLFVEFTNKDARKKTTEFWDRQRTRILAKNQFGFAATDAGPIWMGLRLISAKTSSAYQENTYAKGAYVLEMLRSIMYSTKDGDKAFIEMMHDFVSSYSASPASTETFMAIAEKHIQPWMDLQGNGSLAWFFREWVYGSNVPQYGFTYQVSPGADGKTVLHMNITQSAVDDSFAMTVPVFADFGQGLIRIGQWPVAGNHTATFDVKLPAAPKKVELNSWKQILQR